MSDEDAEVCCDSEEKVWCGTGHRTAELHLSETGLRTDFETGCDAFATPHGEPLGTALTVGGALTVGSTVVGNSPLGGILYSSGMA